MAFKSVLTVTLGATPKPEALNVAQRLARETDGHLDVLCLGVDRVQVGYYFDTASPALMEEGIARARNEAQTAKEAVEKRLRGGTGQWSVRAAISQVGALGEFVGKIARFNDLVVLAKPYADKTDLEAASVLEAALFEGRAPVLVVPETPLGSIGRKVIVGWNGSAEALSAIRAALPILKSADEVSVAIIDPAAHGADQTDPGANLCRMLSRHGVAVEAAVLARTMPHIADVLLRHAADRGADLIVMGAYGHSRLRESILGGATRHMLEDATMPVLLAH